ncbi:MAG: 50S ribosomal protein L23 [Proteobacteria bacterium]|nr:50S ribosomal protein L23 [Pseudomonadota bacterium]
MKSKLPINVLNLVKKPVITEKSTRLSESDQVVFVVDSKATKPQIKQAIEALFNVKVKAVNTLILKGKRKIFRGRVGRRSDYKKAMVSLEKGQRIELGTGL